MNAFAAWGLTVLGLAVISTVAEMLLPQGRLRNAIRSVMATIAVLVIVTPLPQLLNSKITLDFPLDAIKLDSEYIAFVENKNRELIELAATRFLESKGINGVKLDVRLVGYCVKSVTVDFSEIGITGNTAHINKSEITKLLADYFGIEKEAVMAYG